MHSGPENTCPTAVEELGWYDTSHCHESKFVIIRAFWHSGVEFLPTNEGHNAPASDNRSSKVPI